MSQPSFSLRQMRPSACFAAPGEGGGAERRASPTLRPAVQSAFERLVAALRKAGRKDVIEPIAGLERVDDVLRERPAHVPILLDLAWELRNSPGFQSFFIRSGGEEAVTARDQPIAPCDLTYDQLVRAHLYGAARLVFDRRERAWAERRAKRELARWRQKKEREARANLQSRLMAPLKTMLDGEPDLDPEQFRHQYPGYGLYLVLKPHLQEAWQFGFVELYARLGTAQARVLAHLIAQIRSRDLLEIVVELSVDDVGLVRTICRAFAEVQLNLKLASGPRWQLSADDLKARSEAEDQVSVIESITFDTIILHHPAALDSIRDMGLDGRHVIRRLTPIFGDEIWSVLEHPDQLENCRSVPDHLIKILGPIIRWCPPETSTILGHIRDHNLAQDLMQFAREAFSDEELASYLADPVRRPIWNTLPTKFNNAYRYQRDAMEGGNLRNSEDLRMVGGAIFHSLQLGRLEAL